MKRSFLFFFCVLSTLGGNALADECDKLPLTYTVSNPMSVAEIETDNLKDLGGKLKVRPDLPRVPFGFINREWESFKSRIEKGDSVVHFVSDERSWRSLAGREGYAILRKGCVLGTFTTMVN